jgi:hypothetical protein
MPKIKIELPRGEVVKDVLILVDADSGIRTVLIDYDNPEKARQHWFSESEKFMRDEGFVVKKAEEIKQPKHPIAARILLENGKPGRVTIGRIGKSPQHFIKVRATGYCGSKILGSAELSDLATWEITHVPPDLLSVIVQYWSESGWITVEPTYV